MFTLAVSLGSVESLIEYPARMTHCTTAGTPVGVSDSLLRPSIGLEDCDELIADPVQALAGCSRLDQADPNGHSGISPCRGKTALRVAMMA